VADRQSAHPAELLVNQEEYVFALLLQQGPELPAAAAFPAGSGQESLKLLDHLVTSFSN
jgi:hypothetical protein